MIIRVHVSRVDQNPYQSRLEMPPVGELADGILALRERLPDTSGLIHTPVGRLVVGGQAMSWKDWGGTGDGMRVEAEDGVRVQLASGHRRLAAFRVLAAGKDKHASEYEMMPIEIVALDDLAMADIAWQENEKREDVNPVERALALQQAMVDFNLTQEQIGKRRGLTQAAVSNLLRLLELPVEVQVLLRKKVITERHARALVSLVKLNVAPVRMMRLLSRGKDHLDADDIISVADVEQAVRSEIASKTALISSWQPGLPLIGCERTCDECEHLIRVARQFRCGDWDCFRRKTTAWREQVDGPAQAEKRHGDGRGVFQRFAVTGVERCGCCGRMARDVSDGVEWYKREGGDVICNGCWQRAGLPEPEAQPQDVPVTVGEGVVQGGPSVVARQGEGFEDEADEDDEREMGGDARTAQPVRPAQPLVMKPAGPPAVILAVRIQPGDELAARPVMVSIAEQGKPPLAGFLSGRYGDLATLINQACATFFGDISQEMPPAQEVSNG
jgi:ParB/RepB/Spo0J family partition protein